MFINWSDNWRHQQFWLALLLWSIQCPCRLYPTFVMADVVQGLVITAWKQGHEGLKTWQYNMVSSLSSLCNDSPNAIFSRKTIFQVLLSLDESMRSSMQNHNCGWSTVVIWEKVWKMEVEFVKWVCEYIRTGKDKNVIDPEAHCLRKCQCLPELKRIMELSTWLCKESSIS